MGFYDRAADFIKKYEGFAEKATWDVNAYRLGHGSDTLTLPDGTYRKVVQGDKTTLELAAKDLARRIKKDFEPKVVRQIGQNYYDKLPDNAKIALISLSYNYGSITKPAIIDAAKSGDVNKLANAIVESTKNDNAGTPYYNGLRKRRQAEADFAKSGSNQIIQNIPILSKEKSNRNTIVLISVIVLIIIAILLIIFRKKIVSKITKL